MSEPDTLTEPASVPAELVRKNYPIEFCSHLVRAILAGTKTVTHKPLSADGRARLAADGAAAIVSPYGGVGDALWIRSWADDGRGGPIYVHAYRRHHELAGVHGVAMDEVRAGPPPLSNPRHPLLWLDVLEVTLTTVSTVTEEIAAAAGIVAVGGRTGLQEFARQWDGAYRSPLTITENPACWRIRFALRQPASGG